MVSIKQVQQDIQTLSPEALELVAQFVRLLKKSSPAPSERPPIIEPSSNSDTEDWSDFIGCLSAEEDLSVNYKAYLAEGWAQKYGDH